MFDPQFLQEGFLLSVNKLVAIVNYNHMRYPEPTNDFPHITLYIGGCNFG